ncbi:hypothetical protein DL98DRAFT_435020, partial [Cadophora sp. DSE1049]
KAYSQQYLTSSEENALERYLEGISALANPMRIKFIPFVAFIIARQSSILRN